jgi:peptide/nickel transport system ATP-binding protein
MTDEALRVERLCVEFSNRRGVARVLDDVSFSLPRGELLGVVGATGSGKSVLVDALINLLRPPGRIPSGSVLFFGDDLLKASPETLRRIRGARIGTISNNPRSSLHPMRRIGDQLAEVRRTHTGCPAKEAYSAAVAALDRVGINDAERRARSYPHELSGGMAKRVIIAMAMICGAELLIADELSGGLDVTIQAQILEDVRRLIRSQGLSGLLVTRDLGVVAQYCDSVAVLDSGRIVEHSRVESFFSQPSFHGARLLKVFRQTEDSSVEADRKTGKPSESSSGKRPKHILEVRGLRKAFVDERGQQIVAVDDVSFDLAEGETLGLVGESGSGKTTLGRCVLRLIEPSGGNIKLGDTELTRLDEAALRQMRPSMQMVFQDPYNSLNPRRRVAPVLDEPLRNWTSLGRIERRRRAAELVEMVGLDPSQYLDRFPHEMTTGEQQRVAIARAIAVHPKLIVLDEVTSALDPAARAALIDLLRKLQAQHGFAYLFISHDLSVVKALSDRVLVMYLGRAVEQGRSHDVFRAPRHPYTEALIGSVLWPDPSTRGRISVLAGEVPSPINLPQGCYFESRCYRREGACVATRPELNPVTPDRSVSCLVVQRELAGAAAMERRPIPRRHLDDFH